MGSWPVLHGFGRAAAPAPIAAPKAMNSTGPAAPVPGPFQGRGHGWDEASVQTRVQAPALGQISGLQGSDETLPPGAEEVAQSFCGGSSGFHHAFTR